MRRIRPLYRGAGISLPDPEVPKVHEYEGANKRNEDTVVKIIKAAVKKKQPRYIDTKYLLEPKRVSRG